jgi:uncharacterized membrane protein (UPF0127 family)
MKDGDILYFRTETGKRFTAELATTTPMKKKGLMFRDGLPHRQGLFFLYTDPAKRRSMWMKNMRFPLDLVWLDGSLTIVNIRYNCEPCSSDLECPRISSIYKAQHAIEFSAGEADELGLHIGQRIKLTKTEEV